MKELTPTQENLIQDFALDLSMVDNIADMFPCDGGSGMREPRRPVAPIMPTAEQISLAAVYDLAMARERRKTLFENSGGMILKINQLVGV